MGLFTVLLRVVALKNLPPLQKTAACSKDLKFDCDIQSHHDWLSVLDCRFEAILADSFDRILMQPTIQPAQDANMRGTAIELDSKVDQDFSIDPGLTSSLSILRVD